MATYIKGADTYLPDIKPFTPDYKFLSSVLQTRTDKYNANYKATNDLYNKVVYADLSRDDTKERRDQYAEKIVPHVERISGLDLSLASNVDAAKGIFAPFYEDDITVKDMVYTSRYKDQSQKAQNLLNSPDNTVSEKYWDIGKRSMQYKMDEFINADPSEALGMNLPEFVPNVNLFALSQQILENMNPPLKMKMDRYAKNLNPNFDPKQPISRNNQPEIVNTDWIITEQNGALVTGAALQQIRARLLQNPIVQRAYQTEAYVSGMDYATTAVNNGGATSIKNGQEMWASETIRRIEEVNRLKLANDIKGLAKAEQAAVRWSNYKGQNGIIQGSELDKLETEQLSEIEQYKLDIESKKQIRNEAALPSLNLNNTLNKAYNLFMQSNIMDDMQESAQAWSARDYEYEMRENKFAIDEKKFKYNMAEIKARSDNALELAMWKEKRKDERMLKKAELEGLGRANSPLGAVLNKGVPSSTDANTIEGATDSRGNYTPSSDIIETAKAQHGNHIQVVAAEQIGQLLGAKGKPGMLTLMFPKGDNSSENQTYGIELDGKEYRGTIQEIRKKLSLTKNTDGTGGLIYREDIDNLYKTNRDKFIDTRKQTIDNIKLTQGSDATNQYDAMYTSMTGPNGTDIKMKSGDVFIQEAYRIYKEAYDNNDILNTAQGDSDIKGFMEAGMPDIFTDNNIPMNKQEYEAKVIEGVKNGTIKNYDEWGWDTGTSDKDYMMDEVIYTTYMGKSGEGPMIEKVRETKTGRRVLDEKAIKAEAGQVYDELKTNLNAALTDRMDSNTNSASFNSIKYGVKGGYADVISNFKYEYNINPLSRDADSENEMVMMLNQLNYLKENGKPYGIGIGKLSDESQLLEQTALGVKVKDLLIKDLQTWINNPKRSNTASIAPIFRLSYMPVFDRASETNKTHAGYEIDNMDEWLASKKEGTTDNDIGALSVPDIKKLQGTGEGDLESGIFIVFDQQDDQNIKAKKNDYFSTTEIDILSGENPNYAEYIIPNDNGVSPTAKFRVIKNGTGDYSINYNVKRYNPYTPENPKEWNEYTIETGTQSIDWKEELPGLDQQVNNIYKLFEEIRKNNQFLRKKDSIMYGVKGGSDVISNFKYKYNINTLSREADSENEMVMMLNEKTYGKK